MRPEESTNKKQKAIIDMPSYKAGYYAGRTANDNRNDKVAFEADKYLKKDTVVGVLFMVAGLLMILYAIGFGIPYLVVHTSFWSAIGVFGTIIFGLIVITVGWVGVSGD